MFGVIGEKGNNSKYKLRVIALIHCASSNVVLPACHIHAREPLYSNSAVIVWWLGSTSAQNRVPSC